MGVSKPVYTDTPDTSVRRSGREVEVPERFGDVLIEQLSPQNRKSIQNLKFGCEESAQGGVKDYIRLDRIF